MLLSPEINLTSLPMRMLTLRLEDVLIPTIVAAWLARAALMGQRQRLRLPTVLLPLAAWTAIALASSLLGADAQAQTGEDRPPPEGARPRGAKSKSKTPALDSFGRDMTEQARNGEIRIRS